MKTKNNHGVYDHTNTEDQKAMFKARLFAALVTIAALTILTITALYLKQLNDRDKRIEYIEQTHIELK